MKTEKKSLFLFDRGRAVAAVLAAALVLAAVLLTVFGENVSAALLPAAILGVAAVLFIFLNIDYGKILTLLFGLILPVAAMFALENYTRTVWEVSPKIFLMNLLFFYLLYGLCAFLFGSIKWGYLFASLIPMLFGLANYFVVNFRGTPLVPWDLLSVGTAVSVADNYSYTLDWKACFSILAFVWIILIASKSRVKFRPAAFRIPAAVVFAAGLAAFVLGIQTDGFQSFFGMDTTLFTLNVMYRNNGVAGAFLGNLRYLAVEEPSDYSLAEVEELTAPYEEEAQVAEETNDQTDVTQYPNIIVIMNEAFSDLSVWGDFATSQEVMPHFYDLQEEGIGGEIYVSVKGGDTANTEYEFLTGDSMGFLPAGSVPYQQYIHNDMPSMVSYLGSLGYDTLAIHPYRASGWDRDKVYDYFGFDNFLDISSFSNPQTLRGYVSDAAAFDKILEQFEQKEEDERLFVFEVTMQNHGAYSKDSPGFDAYVELTDVSDKTTSVLATEKYLTLINLSDLSLYYLTEYFRDYDEPTIIVMFGDHQPSDYITNVIRRICGVDEPGTVEEIEQGYRVPFVIWANYDLEHAEYDAISTNYLGGIVLDAAGVPRTEYQQYLAEQSKTLPVINANAVMAADGSFMSWDETASYSEILDDYQILQYNHLVDVKNREDWFFGGSVKE